MKALLEGFQALGAARLAAMGAVAIGVLLFLGVVALRGSTPRYALLYGDLDLRESAQITEALGRQHIPYQLAAGGAQISVPADDVARSRLLLAKDGLPTGGSVGYEIFDHTDALTTTQFQQQINETRALEGELSRTIRARDGVRGARVHLVMPRREPFARERQSAQASVMLTMTGAARLDREGVQAILNLVAAAVPGLKAQNVTIVDSRGSVLARAGEPAGAAASVETAEGLRRETEQRLGRAVEDMLERTVGPGHVRAEATVEMDFQHVNETQERYDPDNQVPRSQQSVTSSNKTTEKEGSVSVQNNLPNTDAVSTQNGTQDSKQEETTNFEIGRTVRTTTLDQPTIKRISVAVMVDGIGKPGPDGKPAWAPLPDDELARLTTLAQTAVGYDAKRGDKVDVVSVRFAPEETAPEAPRGWLAAFDTADLMHLAETGLLGAIALTALLVIFRPMVSRLTLAPSAAAAAAALTGGSETRAAMLGGAASAALPSPGSFPSLSAPSPAMALITDESMVNLAHVEGQMRASSIRRVAELVEQHPDETLTIVRTWLAEGAGT